LIEHGWRGFNGFSLYYLSQIASKPGWIYSWIRGKRK